MPILDIPAPDASLAQGDILKGVALYVTDSDWTNDGGSTKRRSGQLCLVVSRPCVVANKPIVTVAAVRGRTNAPPKDIDSFEKVREFLAYARDGMGTPDRFYIGQVPGEQNARYYAELDSLHTITLPSSSELQPFLQTGRVATLNQEFLRHLQLRVFLSFAVEGFDDHSWFSDADLEWLVTTGHAELSRARSELSEAEAAKNRHQSAGDDGTAEKMAKELARLQTNVKTLEARLAPYSNEKSRRDDMHSSK